MESPSIYELFRKCTVRVEIPTKRGTGFLVTPGQLLTCAHVVREAEKLTQIQLRWCDRFLTTIDLDINEDLDVALLHIQQSDHPCVLLGSKGDPGDKFYSYGYPDSKEKRDGDSLTLEYEGPIDRDRLLKVKGENIRDGFSGAPILNQTTLRVCGMIRSQRNVIVPEVPKILRALGGQAVPLDGILECWPNLSKQNAKFHSQDKRWEGSRALELKQGAPSAKAIGIPQNQGKRPSGTTTFVERQDSTLDKLHKLLQANEHLAVSIQGMGGVGKTELAVQYVLHYTETYKAGLCWLNAGEGVGRQIVDFAQAHLDLYLPENIHDEWGKVEYCWQHWPNGEVLIIFDDVKKFEEIKDFLPPSGESRFKKLLTTRKTLGSSFAQLQLKCLTRKDSLKLLRELAGEGCINANDDNANGLCDFFGDLPLGLELAGRYLETNRKTVDYLLKRLENKGLEDARVLKATYPGMTATHDGLLAAFAVSWEDLKENENNQRLAGLLSLFHLAPIPKQLVQNCLRDWDEYDLDDSLDDLVQLHLVRAMDSEDEKSYQLHQLLREFFAVKLKEMADAKKLKSLFCQVMVQVAKQLPQFPSRDQIIDFSKNRPHVEEVANKIEDHLSAGEQVHLFMGLGRSYEVESYYDKAIEWYEKSVSIAERQLADDLLIIIKTNNALAYAYFLRQDYAQAEDYYLATIRVANQHLTKLDIAINDEKAKGIHLALARSNDGLGTVYLYRYGSGSVEGKNAKEWIESAFKVRKKLAGEQHPDTAESADHLGFLYRLMERWEDAENNYQKALIIRQGLGENHLKVAESLNNLATCYYDWANKNYSVWVNKSYPDWANKIRSWARAKYEGAEKLFDKALVLYRNIFCNYNLQLMSPNSANALPIEGKSLVVVAKIDDVYHARIFDRNGNKVIDKGKGEFSPDATLVQELDAALSDQSTDNQTKQSELIQRISLSLGLTLIQHLEVANIAFNLARNCYMLGVLLSIDEKVDLSLDKLDKAKKFFSEASKIRKEKLREHIDIAISYHWLGILYHLLAKLTLRKNYFNEAESFYVQASEMINILLLGNQKMPEIGERLQKMKGEVCEDYRRLLDEDMSHAGTETSQNLR